jgi:hypothetical protein
MQKIIIIFFTLTFYSCSNPPVIVHLIPEEFSGPLYFISDSIKDNITYRYDSCFIRYDIDGIAYQHYNKANVWGTYKRWNNVYSHINKKGEIIGRAYTEPLRDSYCTGAFPKTILSTIIYKNKNDTLNFSTYRCEQFNTINKILGDVPIVNDTFCLQMGR